MSMPPNRETVSARAAATALRIGDIDLNAVYLALDGGAGCIDGGLVHVPDRNARSLACEPRGDTLPNPRCAARYDGPFACKSLADHRLLSFVRLRGFGCHIEHATGNFDFNIDEVSAQRRHVDGDPETGSVRRGYFAVLIPLQTVGGDISSQSLGGEGIFADPVLGEAGKGLQRGAERQVRREGVVHIGDAARRGIVGDPLGRPDAADPAAIDLDEADRP